MEGLVKFTTIKVHQHNLWALAIAIYKILNDLSLPSWETWWLKYVLYMIWEYEKDDNVNLQCTKKSSCEIQGIKPVSYGLKSIKVLRDGS